MGIIKIIIADNFDQSMADYSLAVFGIGLKYLIPFMLLCLVCSALPALLQAGFVLATEALKPNLSALNPVEGAKKLLVCARLKIRSKPYCISHPLWWPPSFAGRNIRLKSFLS